MNEFIYTWCIENISYSWENMGKITSPSFVADTLQNTVWTLRLDPRAKRAECDSDEFLSMYLIRGEDDGPKNFLFDCEFSIVSANNLILKSVNPRKLTSKLEGMISTFFARRDEVFIRKQALYLQQDTLTLRCRMWKREGDKNKFGQCFGRTRLEIERILTVSDMNPRTTRKKTILIHSEKQNKLLISVNICHEKDCLKIELRRRNTAKIKVSTFNFSAEGRNRTPLKYVESWLNMPVGVVWTIPFSNTKNKTSANNNINKLKLRCEFIYSTGEETNSEEKIRPCPFKFLEFPSNCILSCLPSGKLSDCSSVCNDLWNLYLKQILCDIELKTQSKSFWVHRIVLCARSPVFLALFTGERGKKKSECVEMEDIENDTLEKFLSFLYTENIEESEWNTTAELYYLADKYQVHRLKFLCYSFFKDNLDYLNVCKLLLLADKCSDFHLKSKAEAYIVRHHERIFSSSTWKEFSEKQPLMAAIIMLCKYENETDCKTFLLCRQIWTEVKHSGIKHNEITQKEKPAEEYNLSSYPSALDDFRSLYQREALSDIVIQTTSATFPAHKTVLCAGSSELSKLLASGKSIDSLKTEDLEDEIVSRVLLFLYTDSLGDLNWMTATKLYHAAIVYQIERLRIKCSCFFLENLKTSNAADLLKLARDHRDVRLKSLVEDFISLHDIEITSSEDCPETSKIYPPKRIETRLSKRLRLENNSYHRKVLKASNGAHVLKLAHEHRDARLKCLVEDLISLHDIEIISFENCSDAAKIDPPKRLETRLSKRLRLENKSTQKS